MKKIISLCLISTFLATFCACSGKQSDEQRFNSALEKQNSLQQLDATLTVRFTDHGERRLGNREIYQTLQYDLRDAENKLYYLEVDMKVDKIKEENKYILFYKDNYLYDNSGGNKTKFKMEQSEIKREDLLPKIDICNAKAEDVTISQIKKEEEYTLFMYNIPDKDTEKLGVQVKGHYNTFSDGQKALVKGITCSMKVDKKGYILEQTVNMDVEIEGEESNIFAKLVYNNPGGDIQVTALDNLDIYKETKL